MNSKKYAQAKDGTYCLQISSKQETDFNKSYKALHAPGMPSKKDGFSPAAEIGRKKIKNPNTGKFAGFIPTQCLYGWMDSEKNVWIPAGQKKGRTPDHWVLEQEDGARSLVFPITKRRAWRQAQDCVIACDKVMMRSAKDEQAFFEWIKKMSCVEKAWSDGDIFYLALATYDLDRCHIANLVALFRRYKIDLKLLKTFLRKADNPALFKLV